MAGIGTSIQVTDQLSPAFHTMTQSINACLGSFVQMQMATGAGVNTEALHAAQFAMEQMNFETARLEDELNAAARAQQDFNTNVNTGQRVTKGLLTTVSAVAGVYAGLRAIPAVANLSDSVTQTTARFNLMNDGLQTTYELQEMIYQSAQNSRGVYADTANVVSRLGILAEDAFSSNREMIQFAELMNKNFKISGASAQEQSSAMYQLTQAMAAGKLQGDEYRSIIENAPLLASAIEDYMVNVRGAQGSMKEWASNGLLTADVIKSAMFNAADEVNEKFAEIPRTWSDVGNSIKNTALMTFLPVLQEVNALASDNNTQIVVQGITDSLSTLASVAGLALDMLMTGGAFVVENWSTIEPIVLGVAGVFVAYSAGMGAVTLATNVATAAAQGFFMALLTNPVTWVAAGMGLVVYAISDWTRSVGGLRVAWAIAVNEVQYGAAYLQIGVLTMRANVVNACGMIILKFMSMGINVANAMGNMKTSVISSMQDMVNGSIDKINDFINLLNKIPGVALEPITFTASFATNALAEEAQKQSQRAAAYATAESLYQSGVTAQNAEIDQMLATAQYNYKVGQENILAMQQKSSEGTSLFGTDSEIVAGNVATIANNTGSIADSIELSNEDLKYLRDIAERDIIDRTVFRDIKVDLGGVVNQVNEMSDLDGIAEYLGEVVQREMFISAEGVH